MKPLHALFESMFFTSKKDIQKDVLFLAQKERLAH